MAKKDNNLLVLALIILSVLVLSKADWRNPITSDSSQFMQKEKSGTSLGSNLGDGISIDVKVNLCSQSPAGLQAACLSIGGTWVCTATEVGCYNVIIPCNTEPIQSLLTKCGELGAQTTCLPSNISCKY